VVGMGGIESGADALAFMASGATAIAVGTANFRDPQAGLRVREELEAELRSRGIRRPRDLQRPVDSLGRPRPRPELHTN
jgi:dihydroorotate dehydrogenase (NAD+) catalytic subunit